MVTIRRDQVVFGGQGFSFTKARLQARDAFEKVREATVFMVRGVKLLGSDVDNAARLFGKAAMGKSHAMWLACQMPDAMFCVSVGTNLLLRHEARWSLAVWKLRVQARSCVYMTQAL